MCGIHSNHLERCTRLETERDNTNTNKINKMLITGLRFLIHRILKIRFIIIANFQRCPEVAKD